MAFLDEITQSITNLVSDWAMFVYNQSIIGPEGKQKYDDEIAKMAKQTGMSVEETDEMVGMVMGFGLSVKAVSPQQVAQRLELISSKAAALARESPDAAALARKALARVEELSRRAPAAVKGWWARLGDKLSPINALVFPVFVAAQFADYYFFKNRMFIDAVNKLFGTNFSPATTQAQLGAASFTGAEIDLLLDKMRTQGVTGLESQARRTSLPLTRDTLQQELSLLALDIQQAGKIARKDKVLTALMNEAVFASGEAPAAFTTAQPPAAVKPIEPLNVIEIGNIPFGQIVMPSAVIERITNIEDLKSVVSTTISAFFNIIDDRLSFAINRVSRFVAPGGRIIVPNPPSFIEREKRGDTEIQRVVQNKIVVLDIFFTTHENKLQKIYSMPLDYSVADTVITPEAPVDSTPIPVLVDVVKQVLMQQAVPVPAQSPPVAQTPVQAAAPQPVAPQPVRVQEQTVPAPKPDWTPQQYANLGIVRTRNPGLVALVESIHAQYLAGQITLDFFNAEMNRLGWDKIGRVQRTIISIFNERPDLQVAFGPQALTADTDANRKLNDWWNSNGRFEYPLVDLI